MNRREFLSVPALLTAAPAGAATPSPFKGFIVSDAHFGWRDPQQPSPDGSRGAIAKIMSRFPDLDVFVDTGDAHHSYATDADRGNWTDIIAGGCGTVPFIYCMGNHEHAGNEDAETRSCRLGSLSCRPYQSWNIKGIHLVSAPEMIHACYVSEELLHWLELDLAVNKGMTTIILSHNALKGTTKSGYDIGYRQIVNSPAVLGLLERYPNVIAWMHGHNHTWELVPAFNKLFVSNGRIGGFDPGGPGDSGNGHLGGIYFELGADSLKVRGYSVTREAFFDEFDPGSAHMHRTLAVKTTLNRAAPASICYGMGRSRHGQRLPVHRHHAGGGRIEAFLAGVSSPVFNENANLRLYTQRFAQGGKQAASKILAGFAIAPKLGRGLSDGTWEWTSTGVRLKPLEDPSARRSIHVPGAREGRFQYYRCAPGARLRVELEAHCADAGPRIQLLCNVYDSAGNGKASLAGPVWNLTRTAETRSYDFELPAAGGAGPRPALRAAHRAPTGQVGDLPHWGTIYEESASDTELQASIEAVVTGLRSEVNVRRLEIRFAGAQAHTADAELVMDGQRASVAGQLEPGKIHHTEWKTQRAPRGVAEIHAGGSRLVTWLVRESGIEWQVRNAPAAMRDGWLEIGKQRNRFSPRQEIVIVALAGKSELYVHRLRKVNGARIQPASGARRAVVIELGEVTGPAEVELIAARKPLRVEGADSWKFESGRVTITKSSRGTIRVEA